MPTYHKLIRDKIPEMIRASGREPVIRTASESEQVALLSAKLEEEFDELLQSSPDEEIEELADINEVIIAILSLDGRANPSLRARLEEVRFVADEIAKNGGYSDSQIEELRKRKAEERGGFADWIVLVEVKE